MTTKTAAKSGKKAPARKATGKAKTPAQRVVSSVQIVRDTLARNPKATVQMIDAALKRAGFEKSANFVGTIKSEHSWVRIARSRLLVLSAILSCKERQSVRTPGDEPGVILVRLGRTR